MYSYQEDATLHEYTTHGGDSNKTQTRSSINDLRMEYGFDGVKIKDFFEHKANVIPENPHLSKITVRFNFQANHFVMINHIGKSEKHAVNSICTNNNFGILCKN